MTVIPTFRHQKQNDFCESEANLVYIVNSRLAKTDSETLYQKKKKVCVCVCVCVSVKNLNKKALGPGYMQFHTVGVL